jgi:hypothetical protein
MARPAGINRYTPQARDRNEMMDIGGIDLGKRGDDSVGQTDKVGEYRGRSLPAQC